MRISFFHSLFLFILFFFLSGCHNSKKDENPTLFKLMSSEVTGIDFNNKLNYDEEFNVYTFRNFYNGAGVALGDINNDGLVDVFFTGNQVSNRLYLNKGNFKFEDITESAGLSSAGIWSTGVSLVDLNGDGWLDIYVCKSGLVKGERRYNELFVNNGNLTFTEKAKEYKIADVGLSTHAAFFDYDRDNDLDCYLLNNSFRSVAGYDLIKDQRDVRDTLGANKLYRNDGEFFTDVSKEAGIYGSSIGFGLGVTVGDVNKDGWPDFYVSNDFFEKDYLYINNKKGGFIESLEECIREISLGSMGADMGDINNDGYPEIFVTEMLPEEESRLKTKASFENWNKFVLNKKYGYYNQFPRNVLNLNNQDNSFSEIGRMAGVSATDWSWGALIFDMDNDGNKDLFVANGIFKDLTDQDYLHYMADVATVRRMIKTEKGVMKKLVDMIPSNPISNYAFENNGDLTFTNKANDWGLATPSFSNGSAYADLDNDGDLDLVINNMNMPAFVYKNETDKLYKNNNFLKVKLSGEGKNSLAIGAKVTLKTNGKLFYQELHPMKGFESTVDYALHFGIGEIKKIDSVIVTWQNGKNSLLINVKPNQTLLIKQSDGYSSLNPTVVEKVTTYFDSLSPGDLNIDFQHKENQFIDFERDGLIFHMLSNEGPKTSKGDVNGDGLEDFYIGGAKDSPGALFIQTRDGKFRKSNEALFEKDKISEDTESLFFDCDQDGDLDLYVCSGGNEFPGSSSALIDRLYINDGKGNFMKSNQILPSTNFESTSSVAAADFDTDGDLDLFVGVRLQPFWYGSPVNGYLLENDGKGYFKNVTHQKAPQLIKAGMITDGLWMDYDEDTDQDLIISGEYMPIRIFNNEKGFLNEVTKEAGFEKTNGWWNCLLSVDINGDGLLDLVAGNHGKNSTFKVAPSKPVTMYVNDFDRNGTVEQIINVYNKDKSYPVVLRHELLSQLPSLKNKYLKYESYKEQTVTEIFSSEELRNAIKLEAYIMESSSFINNGKGAFTRIALPVEAQFSPIYGLVADDFDGDKKTDILLGGNFYKAKPQVGSYDASYGLLLKGVGNSKFLPVPAKQSGFKVKGEIRSLITLKGIRNNILIVGKNNDQIQVYKY